MLLWSEFESHISDRTAVLQKFQIWSSLLFTLSARHSRIDKLTQKNFLLAAHLDRLKDSPNRHWKDDAINPTTENGHGTDTPALDKDPFALWHGRRLVLSSMSRVTIWVNVPGSTQRKTKQIQFSAHGPYLRENTEIS
jgi:hypothetical protein